MVIMQIKSTGANKTLSSWIRVNGSTIVADTNVQNTLVSTNDQKTVSMEFCFPLVAGDYFEIMMSGDSTNLSIVSI